tara:strand:+ start:589 stop:1701 length:1113 start_codon:yes stop_codon:yes gene_type:complete
MTKADEQEYMSRAVQLAHKGLYTTDPNPRVGCVLVKADEIVGEGWHERAGGPHAEKVALEQAGEKASGSTAFITLEPCCHFGRTGPCVDSLIEAGISRVVCSVVDPNPLVAGVGISKLENAGINVDIGLCSDLAVNLNAGYFRRMKTGRPLVRSKLAVSLDGKTALANGDSQWITGEASRADVHTWRARSSAVLTGVGTVLSDNPSLNARLSRSNIDVMQPYRIVIDSKLQTPLDAKLVDLPGDLVIFINQETFLKSNKKVNRFIEQGVAIESVPGAEQCDLNVVMRRLGDLEINEVWVEAGARFNGALLEAGLIDEIIIYVAPCVLGDDSRGMFSIEPFKMLEEKIQFKYEDIRNFGQDIRITACLVES